MVDAHVSGACVERHAGSSPVLGTIARDFRFWRNGGIGRRATLRGWWALARVSSSLVLGTTNRFRIISKPVLFFLIVIAYFMTAWDAMHPKPPSEKRTQGKCRIINVAAGRE